MRGHEGGATAVHPQNTPLDIGSDHVAGVWRDDDDVEHVRLYTLTKPP
jgi:hypothetical protein